MSKDYQKAIDIIYTGSVDLALVAVKLAKTNPQMFVALASEEDWVAPVIRVIEQKLMSGERFKIPAIRECRNVTGWSLRDAKEAVETLMSERGYVQPESRQY